MGCPQCWGRYMLRDGFRIGPATGTLLFCDILYDFVLHSREHSRPIVVHRSTYIGRYLYQEGACLLESAVYIFSV